MLQVVKLFNAYFIDCCSIVFLKLSVDKGEVIFFQVEDDIVFVCS